MRNNQNKTESNQLKMVCFSGHSVLRCKLSFYDGRYDFNRCARFICFLKENLK